ncbi:PAS domain-containing protein [Kineococcus gynurae]|uniref:PAS domain-containing protein n=1 Tax=Kineococcus gynurae TaxID=452979 RepID=A0ABV5LSB6_9ACTN
MIDALAADDDLGREERLVVRGDGLGYAQLVAALVQAGPNGRALAHLPEGLRRRLVDAVGGTPAPVGLAALPAPEAGAWEYDAVTGLLSFDDAAARLMGLPDGAGQGPLDTRAPARIHPADQPRVAAALEESLSTGHPYETRFRCLMPDDGWAWRASRARALHPTASPSPATTRRPHRRQVPSAPHGRWTRLIGFIAADV